MKLLDYVFITCFGLSIMMISNEIIDIEILNVSLGIAAIIYGYIAVKEDCKDN